MASTCIACGLEVVDGKLQVQLRSGGGINCQNTGAADDGLFINAADVVSAGCGIDVSATGVISADVCASGGLGCGAITGDADCLYVDVQNQAAGPVVPLATAQDPNVIQPNGCNGLVRTEQGLWAPPKTGVAASITSVGSLAGTINQILQTKADTDFPVDHQGPNEYLVGADANSCIVCFCFCNDTCNSFAGITLSRALAPLVVVQPGQSHRFTLWERLKAVPDCAHNAVPLTGTGWARQSEVTFDEFNINGTGKQSGYEFTMVDHSFIEGPPGLCVKGEMCMTYQRFGPGATIGGKPSNALSGAYGEQKEYQFFVVANHHYMPGHDNQTCHTTNP